MHSVKLTFLSALGLVLLLFPQSLLTAEDPPFPKTPNGLSFSDIKGYETWQFIAPSYRTDKNEIRVILGNDTIARAYRSGIPGNREAFPDGSILVKIAYSERKSQAFPAAVEPDVLQRIEFMIKDTKKFAGTNGWGYARFVHDAAKGTFSAYGKDPSFVQECHQCHTLVKNNDYVFTKFPKR